MRKKVGLGATALTILLLTTPLAGQSGKQRDDKERQVAQVLSTLKKGERGEADPDTLKAAIESAGASKITKAVPSLVNLITFRYVPPEERESKHSGVGRSVSAGTFFPDAMYPAVGALLQIGEPALPALVKVIKRCDGDSLASQNARYAVSYIFRENPEAGVSYLEKRAAEAESFEEKERLSQAAEYVKALIRPKDQP